VKLNGEVSRSQHVMMTGSIERSEAAQRQRVGDVTRQASYSQRPSCCCLAFWHFCLHQTSTKIFVVFQRTDSEQYLP